MANSVIAVFHEDIALCPQIFTAAIRPLEGHTALCAAAKEFMGAEKVGALLRLRQHCGA